MNLALIAGVILVFLTSMFTSGRQSTAGVPKKNQY